MMDRREPRFDWGLRVVVREDIFNDGTFPGEPENALLVPANCVGEIVRVGHHEEVNIPVYLVEFSNGRVIGCLENEIFPMGENRP